jgi:DNA mismatch endonuclease (patch repair protein)
VGHSALRVLTVGPDFAFRKLRTVIFVDGCFWHGCPKHCSPMKWLRKSSMPANNPPSPKGGLRRTGRAFWRRKLSTNMKRDALVTRTLLGAGWRVVRI